MYKFRRRCPEWSGGRRGKGPSSQDCLELDGLVCRRRRHHRARAPLCCVANGLCKPGDLLIRPHYTPLSFREPRRMNPTTLQVQIKVAKGCLSTVLVHAPFDHVYLDSRVQCLVLASCLSSREIRAPSCHRTSRPCFGDALFESAAPFAFVPQSRKLAAHGARDERRSLSLPLFPLSLLFSSFLPFSFYFFRWR